MKPFKGALLDDAIWISALPVNVHFIGIMEEVEESHCGPCEKRLDCKKKNRRRLKVYWALWKYHCLEN
jgi:hypothetical protein